MDYLVIHQKALDIASNYLAMESKVVEVLQLVNREKVYKKMGYTSLFTYAVEALKLPPDRVYQFNVVAKKCDEVPELKEAIDQGKLNVSRARRIASVIEKESSVDWIEKAATLPQRESEKEVAKANPKEAVPEKSKILNAEVAFISLSISIEAQEQLERLKDLLSQKFKKPVNLRDVIEYAAETLSQKLDPVKKTEPSRTRKRNLSSRMKARKPIPVQIRHEVLARDQGRCTEVVNGKRCESRRWLDLHHVEFVSRGGQHTKDNIVTLCSGHHRLRHQEQLSPRLPLYSSR